MPFPLLAGIPWLASLIGGLFSGLVAFFAQYLTKRLAVVLVAISVLTTLTAAFSAALSALMTGLLIAMPPQLSQVLGWVVPSNFTACSGAIITGHLLRWVYEWNVKIVQLKLF